MMFNGVYSKRRCLVTGNTGFKGSWLGYWLSRLGAEVCGVSLPAGKTSHWDLLDKEYETLFCDIRDLDKLQKKKIRVRWISSLADASLPDSSSTASRTVRSKALAR